ncbi:MAG: hypothetical protein WCK14_04015 [Actinomycetota bacterium]|jgi:hypothetical protein
MQPVSAESEAKKSTTLKRFGPVIGLVAAVGIGVGALVISGGKDNKVAAPVSTEAAGSSSTPGTGAAGVITYPMNFTQAKEAGVTVDWGKRCDTTTGKVAVPDFFASPCYVPFTGDNGGATAEGVTATDITIVMYQGLPGDPIMAYITDAVQVSDTNDQSTETMQNLIKYYETYYETYGRHVKFVPFVGTGTALDETAARADAVRIAEEIKPFMVWGGPNLTSAFADELAAHKILCLSCTPSQPHDFYTQRDPYVWGIGGSGDQAQIHELELIKKELVGKNATHGGPDFVNSPRKFGSLYIESSASSKISNDQFQKGMVDAGAPVAETVAYELNPGTIQQSASQAIAKFKAAGVTTIVFDGDPVAPRDFTREATAQGYFPEWFIGTSALVDVNAFARTYDQEQWKHAFGYTSLSARLAPETTGAYALYTWFTGNAPPAKDTIALIAPFPAVFYAVLQGLGPNLSPKTWKDALFNAKPTRSAITQPSLSWGDQGIWAIHDDYHGVDDATMIWWDPTATGLDEIRKPGVGMYQFVDGGKRYLPGQWPTTDKFFDPTGAVTMYDKAPGNENAPTYPSPAG